MIRNILQIAAIGCFTTACAAVVDGTSQGITFRSEPPGAECDVERNGQLLRRIVTTETIVVDKTKHDIRLRCRKDGYQDAELVVASKTEESAVANILLGGVVGWAIDSAVGADNKYDRYVTITLTPVDDPEASGDGGPVAEVDPSSDEGGKGDAPASDSEMPEILQESAATPGADT